MNENICVRLIVSEATWIRQEWVTVLTFQDTRGVGAPILVLCDIRTMLCSVSTLRLLSILHSYHSSGSGGSANKSWSTSAYKNAVCTSIATVMWSDSRSLFLSCELAASIVFRDNVDGVGENISAVCAPDIDCCSLSRLTWISLVRLSLDLPMVFETMFCQLPQSLFTTVIALHFFQ